MSIGIDIYVFYVWFLYWWNYLMSGNIICANDDYLSLCLVENLGVLSYNM